MLLIRRIRGSYFSCAATATISLMFSAEIVIGTAALSCVSTVPGRKLIRASPPPAGAGFAGLGRFGGAVAGGPVGGAVAGGAAGAAPRGFTSVACAGPPGAPFRGPKATLICVALPADTP